MIYLLLAQHDKPTNPLSPSPHPYLSLSPTRNLKILAHLALLLRDLHRARLVPTYLASLATRTLHLSPPPSHPSSSAAPTSVVQEGIPYADGRLLDVYLPAAVHGEEVVVGAPVVVYVGGGNWGNWGGGGRGVGREVGVRVRRLGYAVVVAELRGWPEVGVEEMVADLRAVLEWTAGAIMSYGGDPEKIYLMVSGGWRREKGRAGCLRELNPLHRVMVRERTSH